MNSSITVTRQVEFAETDMAGIVHFSNYFRWMEAAEHAFFRSMNLPLTEKHTATISAWPRVKARCSYDAPLRFHDVVEVVLSVKAIKTHSIAYDFTFYKVEGTEKTKAATGEMTTVCAAVNPVNGILKSVPIAEAILAKIELAPAAPRMAGNPATEY